MKLSDKISSFDGHFVSFEYFPPKTEDGKRNLINRVNRMARVLSPLYVDGKSMSFLSFSHFLIFFSKSTLKSFLSGSMRERERERERI